jgi:hypothetical protein
MTPIIRSLTCLRQDIGAIDDRKGRILLARFVAVCAGKGNGMVYR